jgi:hypothetical protein
MSVHKNRSTRLHASLLSSNSIKREKEFLRHAVESFPASYINQDLLRINAVKKSDLLDKFQWQFPMSKDSLLYILGQ